MKWLSQLVRGTFRNAGWVGDDISLDKLVLDMNGHRSTSAGADVSLRSAIGYPPLWRAINIISNDQMIPWAVKRWDDRGGKADDVKHRAYRLIRRSPCNYMDSLNYKSVLQYHALVCGNGYSYVFRDRSPAGGAAPKELMILDPRFTYPVVEITWTSRKLWFVTTVAGEQRKLPGEDVIHIQGLSFDGLVGHSVIDILSDPIGLGLAGQKFASLWFKNGGKAGGYLVTPHKKNQSDLEEMRKSWDLMKPGLDSAQRPGILHGGLDWKQTVLDPEKLQALQSRKFSIYDVSNITGVRPHDLGAESTKGYNGVFAENQSHLNKCMMPWFRKFKMQHEDKLLTEEEKDLETHCIEYDTSDLIVVEVNIQAEADRKDRESGVATPNDICRKRGFPLIPAEQGGDDRHRPSNWVRLDAADATPKQRSTSQKQTQALHDLVVSTAGRLVKIEASKLRDASKNPKDWFAAVESTLASCGAKWSDAIVPVVRVCDSEVNAAELSQTIIAERSTALRQRLLSLADGPAAEFVSRVERWAEQHEIESPLQLSAKLGV